MDSDHDHSAHGLMVWKGTKLLGGCSVDLVLESDTSLELLFYDSHSDHTSVKRYSISGII